MVPQCLALTLLLVVLDSARPLQAHFLWVVAEPEERPDRALVYFSESASPDDPALLDRVANARAWSVPGRRSQPQPLALRKADDALEATLAADAQSAPVVLRHTYGVISRGGEDFLLEYFAKTYPSMLPGTWQSVSDADLLPLELVPQLDGRDLVLRARWQGRPLAQAAVTVTGPGIEGKLEGATDENGAFRCRPVAPGLFSIRVRQVEEQQGEHDGKPYESIRRYSTLSLRLAPPQVTPAAHDWPDLARGITSLGAAVLDDWLYVYGGHYGEAHHYSRDGQSGEFQRLNLGGGTWEPLAGGPKLTGLALVPHQGRLYRVGGFTARNADDEDHDLWSQPDFARFDPDSGTWEVLPDLPEPRSSHDAAVVGDTLYVVGGWNLRGDDETAWHETAWSVDLSAERPAWKPLATPPFRRRAVALAAHAGKLYCLGGMQERGGQTTAVAVFDPETDAWSEGPALPGAPSEGFGASAFACRGRLYVSTMSGAVQRLSAEGDRWEFIGQLEHPRFFHRLLPWRDRDLLIVGGAHMSVGKIERLERVPVGLPANSTP